MKLYYLLAIIPSLFILVSLIPNSFADSTLIGLQLSQACIKSLEYNVTTHCISYDKLKPFEKVNPLLAGKWIDTPYVHKVYRNFLGVWNFASPTNVVLIDPPGDFQLRSKMIIIQSDNFTYTDINDPANNTQYIQHVNRYVYPGCTEAKVAPNFNLINDTISYLLNGCSKTGINDTQIVYRSELPFSSVNPYSSLHYKAYLKALKQVGGLPDCIHHKCVFADPYKKDSYQYIPSNHTKTRR